MAAPPAKKIKVNTAVSSEETNDPQAEEECTTISMVVGKGDCLSAVHRIKGYPWRLRLFENDDGKCELFVRCEKSMEAELWKCKADIKLKEPAHEFEKKFCSMDKKRQECSLGVYSYRRLPVGSRLEVDIVPNENGKKWRSRPIAGLFDSRDGCLVIEDKKIYVNKQSMASVSPFFDRLFNANFKEKNMAEISIGDVEYEEFTNLIRMLYGENGASAVANLLTHDNVRRILVLADRFELKIVEDGVVNTVLSRNSSFSIHEKLFIADQHNLTECKNRIIESYKDSELNELRNTPEFGQLSMDTKDALFKKCCDALTEANTGIKFINRIDNLLEKLDPNDALATKTGDILRITKKLVTIIATDKKNS